LIYVIDVKNEGEDYDLDLKYFERSIKCLRELSPNAKVFILLHKMDEITNHE
jgi:GTPase